MSLKKRYSHYKPFGSLEGGSGCGSGEARSVSDYRFEKGCQCQFVWVSQISRQKGQRTAITCV